MYTCVMSLMTDEADATSKTRPGGPRLQGCREIRGSRRGQGGDDAKKPINR